MNRFRVLEVFADGRHATLLGPLGARHAVELLSGGLRVGDELVGPAPTPGFQLLSGAQGRLLRVIFEQAAKHHAGNAPRTPETA